MLDNARDEAQVRPLLPGGSRCAVLVASRPVLSSLDHRTSVELDPLSTDESAELLGAIAGRDDLRADPTAVDALLQVVRRLAARGR